MTRPPGYMLQVAPDELDLDRFAIVVESRWSPPTTERSAPASEYPDHPPAAPIEHWPAFPGVISVR